VSRRVPPVSFAALPPSAHPESPGEATAGHRPFVSQSTPATGDGSRFASEPALLSASGSQRSVNPKENLNKLPIQSAD
jgi:hypothetical protein